MLYQTLIPLAVLISKGLAVSWIVSGTTWYDSSGAVIDAHGGGVWQVGSTYYFVGSAYSNNEIPNIYHSTDLMNWVHDGYVSTASTAYYVYRPKLFVSGGLYYIWGQQNRDIITFESSSPGSGYSLYGSLLTLPPDGRTFSDCGVFEDPTTGYLYWMSSADSNNFQLNYITGTPPTIGERALDLEGSYEAPGMFYDSGVYYLIMSSKTGYTANENQYWAATSITGTWNGPYDVAPDTTNTYNSQNSAELVIDGSEITAHIFIGDDWTTEGTAASTYNWFPISVTTSAQEIAIRDYAMWTIDLSTGVITEGSASKNKKRFEAEDAHLLGRSVVGHCEDCVTKRSVQNIDPSSNVTFFSIPGIGSKQWVAFHYTVSDPHAGEAFVNVNGEKYILSEHNSNAGFRKTVPIALELAKGDDNILSFGCECKQGHEDSFSVHLDAVDVFDHY